MPHPTDVRTKCWPMITFFFVHKHDIIANNIKKHAITSSMHDYSFAHHACFTWTLSAQLFVNTRV